MKNQDIVMEIFMSKKIQIKYLSDVQRLEKIENGDWVDLRCAEDITLKKGEFKLIPLGVVMKLPKGYEAHLVPRSSTYKKWKIIQANHMGIIDESYCGELDEWKMAVIALEKTRIQKNDRVCQFRIVKKMPKITFKQVFSLGKSRGGFGSTGYN